jgi:hypothetical protein
LGAHPPTSGALHAPTTATMEETAARMTRPGFMKARTSKPYARAGRDTKVTPATTDERFHAPARAADPPRRARDPRAPLWRRYSLRRASLERGDETMMDIRAARRDDPGI